DSFKARMWQQRRAVKDLDLALREAQSRWIRVDRARKSVPTNNGEFAERVAALKQRIDALQVRLADNEQKLQGYLAPLAIHELDEKRPCLAAYQGQGGVGRATMYDGAAKEETPKKGRGAAVQKSREESKQGEEPQPAETPKAGEEPKP